jgi:hypothetical protein
VASVRVSVCVCVCVCVCVSCVCVHIERVPRKNRHVCLLAHACVHVCLPLCAGVLGKAQCRHEVGGEVGERVVTYALLAHTAATYVNSTRQPTKPRPSRISMCGGPELPCGGAMNMIQIQLLLGSLKSNLGQGNKRPSGNFCHREENPISATDPLAPSHQTGTPHTDGHWCRVYVTFTSRSLLPGGVGRDHSGVTCEATYSRLE